MDKAYVKKAFVYHAPFGTQQRRYQAIRDLGGEFASLIFEMCPDSPERTLAIRKLQETSMWANASIAINEVQAEQVEEFVPTPEPGEVFPP